MNAFDVFSTKFFWKTVADGEAGKGGMDEKAMYGNETPPPRPDDGELQTIKFLSGANIMTVGSSKCLIALFDMLQKLFAVH